MTASTDDRTTPVTIRILDKEYRIACAPEEQHGLIDSARLLDQRMREVRQNGRVIGADRIAVMASLNLVYELMRERDDARDQHQRLQSLQERVAAAVEPDIATIPEPSRETTELDAANDKV